MNKSFLSTNELSLAVELLLWTELRDRKEPPKVALSQNVLKLGEGKENVGKEEEDMNILFFFLLWFDRCA